MSSSPSASASQTASSTSSTASPSDGSSSMSMSMSPSLSASSTSSSSSSTSTGNPSGLGPASSTLYLFTFLATLFLLLAISSAIIMRGIFLRRRFRRRMEEAIAAGVFMNPSDDGAGGLGGGRTPRRKLHRPTLFDISVPPPYFSTSNPQDAKWEKVMPFAGCVSSEKPGLEPPPNTDSNASSNVPPGTRDEGHAAAMRAYLAVADPRHYFRRHRLRSNRGHSTPTLPTALAPSVGAGAETATPAIPLKPLEPVERAEEVRLAVVIAMPNPHRSGYVSPSVDAEQPSYAADTAAKMHGWGAEGGEEAGVPDVVLGTVRVPLVAPPPSPVPEELVS